MRLKSVRSLESLLLELYRIRGEEVCSAPITRAVKLGTWRDEKPDEDAMVVRFILLSQRTSMAFEFINALFAS